MPSQPFEENKANALFGLKMLYVLITLGGGLANMGDVLLAPAYAIAETSALAPAYEAVSFAPAETGGHSDVVAAAVNALQEAEL
jgi:hypothetical protein